MQLETIADCERVLANLVYNTRRDSGGSFTTQRTKQLASMVGNPHEKLRVVHVAGTSGKTSTCYFIDALLRSSGVTTGLTVSPHITSVADRAQINGQPLSEEKYVQYFETFWRLVDTVESQPSYFEFMLVFALWVFAEEKVGYAVVETGLGGLHDSSNICARPDKVCVLTDIGFDHQAVLGDTLSEIATQKAGIIWRENEVFMYNQSEEVMKAVNTRVAEMGAEFHTVVRSNIDPESKLPAFQQRNWQLAREVYHHIAHRDKLTVPETDIPWQVVVPARMEEYVVDGRSIIIDGAHNEQKMRTFFESFVEKYGGEEPILLLSLKNGKDLQGVAPAIAQYTHKAIVTEFTSEQDMPFGAQSAELIAEELQRSGVQAVVQKNVELALRELVGKPGIGVVVGSLYLAAEVRALLQGK